MNLTTEQWQKGFRKGRVKPPIQINKEEHATQSIKNHPKKNEEPSTCSQNMKH